MSKLIVNCSLLIVFRKAITNYQLAVNNYRAFTLVEILIAITLISSLSVLAIPNLRKFNEDQVLADTTNDLVRALKQAQSSSMSGIRCSAGTSTSWSVEFSSSTFKILCSYNLAGVAATPENFYEKTVSGVTITCTGGVGTPRIIFNKNEVSATGCTATSGKYTINVVKGSQSKIITVDKGGSISAN